MITGSETTHLTVKALPIFLEGKLPLIPAKDAIALGLREDQLVRPMVAVRNEQLKLILQGHAFDPPPHARLQAGDQPLMRVQILASGAAQLRPVEQPPATQTAATTLPVIPRLERLALHPLGMDALLNLLRPGGLQTLLPAAALANPEINALVLALLKLRPNMDSLRGESLRQAILGSGFLTEALLARGKPQTVDTKSLLRQLLRRLEGMGLGDHASGVMSDAIDDIESHQIQAIENRTPHEAPLQLALGFANAPPVELKISREPERNDGERPWAVNIHSQSERWGELWLQTRVFSDERVELTMWAQREDVYSAAQQNSRALASELANAGLDLIGFQVVHGARPGEAPQWAPPDSGSLIDVEA